MRKEKHIKGKRYGMDQLGIALLLITGVLAILGLLFHDEDIHLISWLVFLLCIYRIISKQLIARYRENVYFLKLINPIRKIIYVKAARSKDKEHKYCHCPSCSQTIRIERHKEKAVVSCPICKTEFIK